MTPSSPSFSRSSKLRKGPPRALGMIGTVIFGLLLVLIGYFVGREILMMGTELFEGGR